ncbi:hypothetical protein AB1Y20_008011 [Prymnesium parvum]|uniref:Uncharacterized protein n=1 Tax=Prymnesium parvum TaxID=97485 RepID=A0AB34ITE4_PRYPA
MITEVDDANDSATSKITWTKERDIALLGQIVKVGKAAFETNRGGGKSKDGNKQLTQEQIWAGPGGIVSVLKQDSPRSVEISNIAVAELVCAEAPAIYSVVCVVLVWHWAPEAPSAAWH